VLRRIFGSKIDGVTRNWRKLHSEELHNLYSLPDIIRLMKSRRMRWPRNIKEYSTHGEKGKAYRILMGRPEGKRPLGRPRRKWVDDVKMDLR
jgi:hypothetical protein